jgi:Htaa
VALRQVLRASLVTVAVGAASLAVAAPASATPAAPAAVATTHHHSSSVKQLHGWQTTLKLDAGTAKVLKDNGVSVTPTGAAHPSGAKIAFPITGGSIDPTTLAGTIEHSGGLKFSAGGKSLGVQDFVIDTAKGVLTAKVSGTDTRVPLLDLNLSGAKISNDGKGVTVRGVKATLTTEAAAALNKTFGVSLFAKGIPIGTAKVVTCF